MTRSRERKRKAEARPTVERLFDELRDASAVVARLQADRKLTEPLRDAALEVALGEAVRRRAERKLLER